MATRIIARPLAYKHLFSSLPRLVQPYSQPATNQYQNILVETLIPALAKVYLLHFLTHLHFKTLADVSVIEQSPSIAPEP